MSERVYLVTGGAGFVGSHVVEHIIKNSDGLPKIYVVDSLNYSGTMDRLRDIDLGQGENALDAITMIHWDFTRPAEPNLVKELSDVTHILHLGAESHVDNSIADPQRFVDANVTGTVNVLQLARQLPNLVVMNMFSTDEVFGPAPMEGTGGFKETDRHNPKNPYAATKSAAEMMCIAFANTYKMPIFVTNGMNIIGERQHPEKFLPLVIKKALYGGTVEVHGTPDKTQAGMRTYIHARNVASAVMFLLDNHTPDCHEVEVFNIVGEEEMDNLSFAKLIAEYTTMIAEEMNMVPEDCDFEIVDFHSQRPGHDLRYALDGTKMKDIGWEPPKALRDSLRKTIKWYLSNLEWLNK
jgi:dTDP-glucose 4,6-dehydratase